MRRLIGNLAAHPLIIAAAIWVLVLATCLQTSGLLANELETLVYAKHWLDPSYIAGDWRLDMHPGPRLPFMLVLAPLLILLPLGQVSIVGAALGYLLVALGLGALFARLGLSAVEAVAVVGLFLFAQQSVTAGEWIFLNFEGKIIAYTLVLFALAVAARGPLVLAGALLGLATTMHVIVGGWSTLFFAIAVLATSRGDAKERVLAVGAYVIGALPVMIALLTADTTSSSQLPDGVMAEWIYVRLRAPHHLDPRGFLPRRLTQKAVELGLMLSVALAFFALPRFLERSDPRLFVARFVQASFLPWTVGVAASFIPGGEKFQQFYPFRIADSLGLLLASAVVLALVVPRIPTRPLGIAARVAVAITAVVFAYKADPRESPERAPEGFESVAHFIQSHAPVARPVLITPHLDHAGYWMERPVVGLWKFVPHQGALIAEWYNRMVDLAAIIPPDRPGGRPRFAPVGAFNRLSTDEYRTLAAKYGAHYLVLRRRGDLELELPIAFENAEFMVYEIGPR
jgi:hypothetical protein